jgi:two-component system cell cycle sensor histidine kinase/response regulator CckA
MKILLVEDNPGDARLLQEMMKEADAVQYELTWADLLDKALKLLGEKPFDLVLLDLGLPGSIGMDTYKKVHSQVPNVPIVILSGFDSETFAAEAEKSGAKGYLNKNNVDIKLLVRTINDAVKRKRS